MSTTESNLIDRKREEEGETKESVRRVGCSKTGRAVSCSVSTRAKERCTHNLPIVETHSVEDDSQVILGLTGIRKSTVGSHVRLETIDSSRSPRDVGSTELLNGSDSSKGPEVTVRDPGELLLDLLHVVSSKVESVVGSVLGLRVESHSSL